MRVRALKNFGGRVVWCVGLVGPLSLGACSGDDGAAQTHPVIAVQPPNAGGFAPELNSPHMPAAPDMQNPLQQPTQQGPVPNPDAPAADNHLQTQPTTPVSTGDNSFCGALSVFRTSCQGCHGSELVGGAPMPIVTYDDTQAAAISDPTKPVHALIGTRIHDAQRPMPPVSQTALTADQLGAIDTWLTAGAPNASGECTGIAEEPTPVDETEIVWPEDCEERYEIRANDGRGGPYFVPANAELNINITIPVPWANKGTGPVQALAIRPISNNKRVVHHWILYAGAGEFVTSWSPGKPFETFPDDVGVRMPTSGNFRLNMHYFNVGNNEDELDDSGLEVCITRNLRPQTATTHMFGSPTAATVPSGGKVSNASTCTVRSSEPIHIITSSPHMHSYGVGAKMEIVHTDGTVEVLEDGPFNWADQHVTPVDAVANNGDQIRITCEYFNDSGRTVTFGNSSQDEMCFNFARYYPADGFSCFGF